MAKPSQKDLRRWTEELRLNDERARESLESFHQVTLAAGTLFHNECLYPERSQSLQTGSE